MICQTSRKSSNGFSPRKMTKVLKTLIARLFWSTLTQKIFLLWCFVSFCLLEGKSLIWTHFKDDEEDEKTTIRVLRHIELIDDEAGEYGIRIIKSNDDLMAKKFGYRSRPGITYFRKGFVDQFFNHFIQIKRNNL